MRGSDRVLARSLERSRRDWPFQLADGPRELVIAHRAPELYRTFRRWALPSDLVVLRSLRAKSQFERENYGDPDRVDGQGTHDRFNA